MTVTGPEETTTMTIHIDPEPLLAVLDERGWRQGTYDDSEGVCLHGAVRLCVPVPGDAQLVEQVAARQGWGTAWNDAPDRAENDVRALLASGVDVTDDDLAETFGPQWRAVVALVRRAAVLTVDETQQLDAARGVAWPATRLAAWTAAWNAALDAARGDAWDAALDAAGAAWDAAWDVARNAAGAVATWDLATPDGPYTIEQRDLLIAPWVSVCGPPDGLLDTVEADR